MHVNAGEGLAEQRIARGAALCAVDPWDACQDLQATEWQVMGERVSNSAKKVPRSRAPCRCIQAEQLWLQTAHLPEGGSIAGGAGGRGGGAGGM